jgi:hypothetical protein
MKLIIRAMLIMFALAIGTSFTYACSCANPSVREKFRNADAVFVGYLLSIKDSNVEEFPHSIKFRVEKHWKGVAGNNVTVLFAFDNPGWCGDLPLTKGEQYLIYAYHQKEGLVTYIDCGPNRIAQNVPDEMRKLNGFGFRLFARLYPFPKF